MSVFINVPTFNFNYVKVGAFSYDVKGAGTDGGRDVYGNASAIDFGGGRLEAEFSKCLIHTSEQFEYVNMVRARMNGSYRYMNIPIYTDYMGPFASDSFISGITHSDGSLFSDGGGYSQPTVFGTLAEDAALNAGQITINVYGAARRLRHSDWFSISHSVKGHRAYSFWECSDPVDVSETIDEVLYEGQQYTIALDIPIRQAASAGTRIEFARPKFVARFPRGFTLPFTMELDRTARVTFKFMEP